MMERGGLGLGAACCTSVSARGTTPKAGKATRSATGALAAVAAARAAAKASAAGWAEAGQLAKKQLAYAAQVGLVFVIQSRFFLSFTIVVFFAEAPVSTEHGGERHHEWRGCRVQI